MVRSLFAGTLMRIVWKLFVLVTGVFIIVYIAATTQNFLVLGVLGIVISAALSSEVRRILADIWRADFFRLKP